jgi:uncharacterized protein (TIGR02453 family)
VRFQANLGISGTNRRANEIITGVSVTKATAKKQRQEQAASEAFTGFPAAGIQFLRDLKNNNDREWFRERKDRYKAEVEEPMARLALEVASACRRSGLMIAAKDKNPVMRVYRDIRFSPNKQPFKTHVSAGLHSTQGKNLTGEVYLHVSPEESLVAAGFWMPERPFLRTWRDAMADKPAVFQKVVKALAKHDLSLSEEHRLTRLPRGYDHLAGSTIEPFLKLTSFIVWRPVSAKEYRSAELAKIATAFALAAKPLLEFGWGLDYAPQRDILEER